jgi:hypothetical protein
MSHEKQRPLSRILGKGLTRHWRIGDREIPWQVASQQSPPPFLPASPFDPKTVLDVMRFRPANIRLINSRFPLADDSVADTQP